jgi:hypothetical protein
MADDDKSGKVVNAIVEIAKAVPVYQDAVQPAAREVGKGLQTVAKAVNMALTPLAILVWGYDQIRMFVEARVTEKLRDVPPERIVSPSPTIAGPVLEALRFAGHEPTLRELYANLLATSLDSSTALQAHPAFVEIIKSLSPDEARVLAAFVGIEGHAIVDVQLHGLPNGGFEIVFENLSFVGEAADCEHSDLVPAYLNNLCRLGLLEIPPSQYFSDPALYERLERHPVVESLRASAAVQGRTIECDPGAARLTPFGKQFCRACVVSEPSLAR